MREFFKAILRDIKRLSGSNQYEQIAAIPEKEKAQYELDLLLNDLVFECTKFSYIPDVDKARIIKAAIVDAEEFYGLNARFVYRSLQKVSGKYFRESQHIETNKLIGNESNAVPLEDCSPETQKLVKEFQATLAGGKIQVVPAATPFELDKIKNEDEARVTRKSNSAGYQTDAQIIIIKEKLMLAVQSRGLHLCDFTDLKVFSVEGENIRARTLDEAQEIYLEVYT